MYEARQNKEKEDHIFSRQEMEQKRLSFKLIDNRRSIAENLSKQKSSITPTNILQMFPPYLSKKEAEQLVRDVFWEKEIEFSWDIANPYIDKIMYDDDIKRTRTGWRNQDSVKYYLREIIKVERQPDVIYDNMMGKYGSIPSNIVKELVEDYKADLTTLAKALNTITSESGHWNAVRIISSDESELKLTVLQNDDLRVFAGKDRVFKDIKKALHKG